MSVTHLKKKDVVKSEEVWEESKYTKPLEITRRFANDDTIMKARRVKSVEMKPSQRFIHFLVMKNVTPRFGKRDTTSFMDLSYMNHLTARRLVNLPRVMMRHMSYVISVKDHELPYGDWLTMVFEAFGVPLVDKKGEEPKRYDFFEETFLTMCKLTRENGIWWIGSGENRRRDDAPEEEEEEEEERNQDDFGEEEPVMKLQRHQRVQTSSSTRRERSRTYESTPRVPLAESRLYEISSEFERKRASRFHDELEKAKGENAELLALLHQAQTKPHP
ncbi:hypothetical protein Dimus_035871 [Dionaea muscipula]